jgi:DNA-binding NarL/FixJ family response regulator
VVGEAAPLRAAVQALAGRARVRLGATMSVTEALPLTRRETEVLKLLAAGLIKRQIAEPALH